MVLQRILSKIQYPKIILLILSIGLSYALFRADFFLIVANTLNSYGYFSMFLAGFLFAYGFTAPFAVGFFASLAPEINIGLGALLSGVGAFFGDILIFQFIRTSFQDEFDKLKLSKIFMWLREKFDKHFKEEAKKYTLWVIAGFLIASPLPDEFGVSLLSGFTKINEKIFAIISYSLNTLGIFLILLYFA